jgi:transposase
MCFSCMVSSNADMWCSRKRLSRAKVLPFMAQLPPCLIGMEASGGTHYWARELTKLGHTVTLMSPQFVRP